MGTHSNYLPQNFRENDRTFAVGLSTVDKLSTRPKGAAADAVALAVAAAAATASVTSKPWPALFWRDIDLRKFRRKLIRDPFFDLFLRTAAVASSPSSSSSESEPKSSNLGVAPSSYSLGVGSSVSNPKPDPPVPACLAAPFSLERAEYRLLRFTELDAAELKILAGQA